MGARPFLPTGATPMKNAHLRLGALEFVRTTRESTLHVRVHMSKLIAEHNAESGPEAVGHFASVFGGDQDLAAVAAALVENLPFQASGPDLPSLRLRFGES